MPAHLFDTDPIFGCWLWLGLRDRDGYGVAHKNGHPTQAHRAVWLDLKGPIPEGKLLDHLCRRRHCVNPDHLEPVSSSVNQLRRVWAYRAQRKKCNAGHELAIHAMVTPEGGRLCRLCHGPKQRNGQ